MIVSFDNDYLEPLYEGQEVKGKPRFSQSVIKSFITKVNILKYVDNSHGLRAYRSLNFEKLEGNENLYSIRIDRRYRLEFRLESYGVTLLEMVVIEDLTNHYQ
ncbi:MAG: addiction module killer protein [Pedobacter sp.]|nr:MAG: addiction module killer protein [Pedobacter sp.]